jgi:membrane associated rhomboid family serine protease
MKRIEPMKTDSKLVLAVLVGVSIGVFGILGTMVIHAQQPKVAPGYVIA